MRLDLPGDLFAADDDGFVILEARRARRPERLQVGAVLSAGVADLWSWVIVREVAGEIVVAEILNPGGVRGAQVIDELDESVLAEIEARFEGLGDRFHPGDVATIRDQGAALDGDGVSVLADGALSQRTNSELLASADPACLWELAQRLVDHHTIGTMRA